MTLQRFFKNDRGFYTYRASVRNGKIRKFRIFPDRRGYQPQFGGWYEIGDVVEKGTYGFAKIVPLPTLTIEDSTLRLLERRIPYRLFLLLVNKNDSGEWKPPQKIESVWANHILDDCREALDNIIGELRFRYFESLEYGSEPPEIWRARFELDSTAEDILKDIPEYYRQSIDKEQLSRALEKAKSYIEELRSRLESIAEIAIKSPAK